MKRLAKAPKSPPRARPAGRSISRNLTTSLAILVFAGTSVLAVAGYVQEKRHVERDLENKADEYITRVSEILALPMWNLDLSQIRLIGNVFIENEDICEVSITGQGDEILFETRDKSQGCFQVRRATNVVYDDRVLGRVDIGFTTVPMKDQLALVVRSNLIILLIVLVLIVSSTGFLLGAFLRRPLRILQRSMDALAEGDYGTAFQSVRYSELLEIAVRFNEMSLKIQAREEEIRMKTEELDRFFTLAPDLLCIADGEGRFLRLNPQWTETLGYSDEEMEETRFLDLVHPEDLSTSEKALIAVHGKGEVLNFTNRYRCKNGDYRWVEWHSYARENLLYCAGRDITDRKVAEEAIREAHARVRRNFEFTEALLNAVPTPVFFKDVEGVYLGCNKAFTEVTGIAAEELKGRRLDECWPDEYAKFYRQRDLEIIQTGERQKYDFAVMDKNGNKRDAVFIKDVFRDEEGQVAGIVGTFIDVTESRKAEEALRQSEERFSKAFKSSPAPIVISEIETGVFIDLNDRWLQMLGYEREELIGRTSKEVGIWEDPEARDRMIRVLHEKGSFRDVPIRFRRKTGEIIVGLWSGEIIVLENRRVLLSLLYDVTETKKAEESLKASEVKFRTLVEQMPNAFVYMVGLDEKRSTLYISPQIEELVGFTPEQYLADPNLWLSRVHPEDRSLYMSQMELSRRTGQPFLCEYRTISRNERVLWFHDEAQLAGDERGNPLYIIGVGTDITELKTAQEELARHRDQLEELVRERTLELEAAQEELLKRERLAVLGQLTATVSHELRNPLGVIRSSAYYLQKRVKDADEKTRKHLNRIDEQVTRCDAIVEDLLEFTRGRHADMSGGDMNAWLRELLPQICDFHNVRTKWELSGQMPLISFDREKMRRVMLNLIQNAHQAVEMRKSIAGQSTPAYEARITVQTDWTGTMAVILVEDNGIGMEKETLKRAMEPLFTTRARGTGLGLAIVQKIVKEHGGSVEIESQESCGTRVKIFLPQTGAIQPLVPGTEPKTKGM